MENKSAYTSFLIPNAPEIRKISLNFLLNNPSSFFYSNQIVLTPELWHESSIKILTPNDENIDFNDNNKANKIILNVIHLGNKEEVNFLRNKVNYLTKVMFPNNDFQIRFFTRRKGIIFPGFLASMTGDLIIGGAGYNLLNETHYAKIPILSFPFSRKLDDQFSRLIEWKNLFPETIYTSLDSLKNNYGKVISQKRTFDLNIFDGAFRASEYLESLILNKNK
jgi:hypothetical protein